MTHKKKKQHKVNEEQQHHVPNDNHHNNQPNEQQLVEEEETTPVIDLTQEEEPIPQPLIELAHGYAYISLKGFYIDTIGLQRQGVSPSFIQNRITRDGHNESHVTIINRVELKNAMEIANIEFPKKRKSKAMKKLIQWIVDRVGEPSHWKEQDWPIDLGVAYIKKQEEQMTSEAYYRVLHWPLGQKIRALFNLEPAFFHVTLGFAPKDVHGIYKGPGTLLCLRGDHLYSRFVHHHFDDEENVEQGTPMIKELSRLLQIVPQYTMDKVFLSALAKQCSCYSEQLNTHCIDWTFIHQYITSHHNDDTEETWFDAPEIPLSPAPSSSSRQL